MLANSGRYPFHLRPKNKQAFQYMRMAADMIHDLELDQQQPVSSSWSDSPALSDEQLNAIRAYLGYFYVVSTWVSSQNFLFFLVLTGDDKIPCHLETKQGYRNSIYRMDS